MPSGKKLTHNIFLHRANSIHKNKYSYLSKYQTNSTKIKILCPIHGIFYQIASDHLRGKGCKNCGYKTTIIKRMLLSKTKFVNCANRIHNNRYKYNLNSFITTKDKMIIYCPIHGQFQQTPNSHLNGRGCPTCRFSIFKLEKSWLKSLQLPKHIKYNVRIKENNRWYIVDALDIKTKTIYEFYGDYWHGNPKKFKGLNKSINKPFSMLYRETLKREKELICAGYNVISIWESDFKKQL